MADNLTSHSFIDTLAMKLINIENIPVKVLKSAKDSPLVNDQSWCPGMDKTVYNRVESMINEIQIGKESTVLSYANKFDKSSVFTSRSTPL